LNKIILCSPEAQIFKLYSTCSINSVENLHSFNILYTCNVQLKTKTTTTTKTITTKKQQQKTKQKNGAVFLFNI
jgi:hypothetical protein